MRIIITGAKASGKTTVGRLLAERLGVPFVDLDDSVLRLAAEQGMRADSCAGVYAALGEEAFRGFERRALEEMQQDDYLVLSTGGSTLLDPVARRLVQGGPILVFLTAEAGVLWERLAGFGTPAYLAGEADPRAAFAKRVALINEVLTPRCDLRIPTDATDVEEVVASIVTGLHQVLAVRAETPNTHGEVVRLTTFGESHGPMMGAVLDGVRPGLPISAEEIQRDLDRRRPGQSRISTPRKEKDTVEIVSGVFEGRTTGAPIGLLIRNADSRSQHYDGIKDVFRPGHADYTFWQKYGIRDYRGGGRSSGRETASRVAGGAVARKILAGRGVTIRAHTVRIADIEAEALDYDAIEQNPVRCADPVAAAQMEERILQAKEQGNSVGGIVQVEATGLPPGLGDPVFGKLDARLAAGLFTIGAVKGLAFGSGFACAGMTGEEHNDGMRDGEFLSNHAGGLLGGITTGQPLIARLAVKPTASIEREQQTIDLEGGNRTIAIEGRHDPCIVPRIVPVVEAMVALVLLDAWEIQERIRPGWWTPESHPAD